MAAKSITLKVEGMTCNHCVMHVKSALEEDVDGVKSAEVSLDSGEATIEYDESTASLEQMASAVEEAGYKLVLPASA
jgi:copper ion binding protein